ncbi:MAG: hypothetical protein Q8R40_00470 [bacterium]|nr:hypothetical protein [bacterium]
MKFLSPLKYIIRVAVGIFQGRFSQTAVLGWGICVIVILLVIICSWDAYLFTQSIAPPKGDDVTEPRTTLTSKEIDNAIHILDQQQIEFNKLIGQSTGTTTNPF